MRSPATKERILQLIEGGLIERARLLDLFQQIENQLIRFPAIDTTKFRQAVTTACETRP